MRYKTNLQNIKILGGRGKGYIFKVRLMGLRGGVRPCEFAPTADLATGSRLAPNRVSSLHTRGGTFPGPLPPSDQEPPRDCSTKGPHGCRSIVIGSLRRRNQTFFFIFYDEHKQETAPRGNKELRVSSCVNLNVTG